MNCCNIAILLCNECHRVASLEVVKKVDHVELN